MRLQFRENAGISLDGDGTLYDPRNLHEEIFSAFFQRFGIDVPVVFNGTTPEALLEIWVNGFSGAEQEDARITAEECRKYYEAQMYGVYRERIEEVQLFPDAERFLDRTDHIRRGLTTNSRKSWVDLLEPHLQLQRRFKAIHGWEDYDGQAKPHPFPLELTARSLGLLSPSHLIYVGDTLTDVRAGIAAGCKAVIFLHRNSDIPLEINGYRDDTRVKIVNSLDEIEVL